MIKRGFKKTRSPERAGGFFCRSALVAAAGDVYKRQIRALAETLGVNMMTVSKAYTQLKQEGYLLADRRAGTVVAPCRTGVMPQSARAALEMAVSEARAAGVPLETVLDLCRRAYGET